MGYWSDPPDPHPIKALPPRDPAADLRTLIDGAIRDAMRTTLEIVPHDQKARTTITTAMPHVLCPR